MVRIVDGTQTSEAEAHILVTELLCYRIGLSLSGRDQTGGRPGRC